jgi:long-chain acyl-CoA synthetase
MYSHTPTPTPFWQRPSWTDERIAILDGRTRNCLTYEQLYEAVERGADRLKSPHKKLALLRTSHDADCLVCYLALLAAGYAVWLWPGERLSTRDLALIERYRPDAIIWGNCPELQVNEVEYPDRQALSGCTLYLRHGAQEPIHPDLGLLLPTSGSTGSPRLVRLSFDNVATNAAQIVKALSIDSAERWLCSLPFHYVFGLSVVNSALCAGATLVLGDKTVMQQGFWQLCKEHGVTSLPAVPSQLELMRQVGHDFDSIAPIRKIAAAGGAMTLPVHRWLAEKMAAHGVEIHSMYGMTEAAGRIAVLPPEEFATSPNCVGRAVAGGELRILADGEIEYAGPNVMMGYADDRACLTLGDSLGGAIRTGDLGRLDESGRLYISGRRNRLCKLFGLRIDLDDVEALCGDIAPMAAVSNERAIYIFHTVTNSGTIATRLQQLSAHMRLPIVAFVARQIDSIPKTASGKTHYAGLVDLL